MTHIPAMKMNSPTATAMHSIRIAVKPAHSPTQSILHCMILLFICYRQLSNICTRMHSFCCCDGIKLKPNKQKELKRHLLCDTGIIADRIEPANNTGTNNINITCNKRKSHMIYLYDISAVSRCNPFVRDIVSACVSSVYS